MWSSTITKFSLNKILANAAARIHTKDNHSRASEIAIWDSGLHVHDGWFGPSPSCTIQAHLANATQLSLHWKTTKQKSMRLS